MIREDGKLMIKQPVPIIILTLCTMIVLFLAGLSMNETEDQSKGEDVKTIKIWGAVPKGSGPQDVIDAFNKEFAEKGLQAQYYQYSNTKAGNTRLDSMLQSGGSVDVFFSYTTAELETRYSQELMVNLDELLAEDQIELEQWYELDVSAYQLNGSYYALPSKLEQGGIVVNLDMFQEAGIELPQEWDYKEFRQTAKLLTKGSGTDKVYGMYFDTSQDLGYIFDFIAPRSLGGNPLGKKETAEVSFQNPMMKAMVDMVAGMMNEDGSAPTHEESVTQKLTQEYMFYSGKTAMTIGAWVIRNVNNQALYPHEFTTAFVPYPVYDKEGVTYAQGGMGDYLSISSYSAYPQEAWEFIKWYISEGMLPMVKGSRIPASKLIARDEILSLLEEAIGGCVDMNSTTRILVDYKENYAVPEKLGGDAILYEAAESRLEQILTNNNR